MQNEVFFVFGGYSYDNGARRPTIAQYNPNTDSWTKLGDLNKARSDNDVIASGGAFLVVGFGPTEKCELEENAIKCTNQDPYVSRYG